MNEKLIELNAYVREKTKFDLVTFVIKPFEDNEILHNSILTRQNMLIEDNINLDIPLIKPEYITFDMICLEFEKNHCKIIDKSVFVKETENDNIIMSRTQIMTSYEHLIYHIKN